MSSMTPYAEEIATVWRFLSLGLSHPQAREQLLSLNFSYPFRKAPLGYCESTAAFREFAQSEAVDLDVLSRWGAFDNRLNGSVVGWWEQPDGSYRFWVLEDVVVIPDASRSLPCYINHPINRANPPVIKLVSSPLDAARLIASGEAAVATGMSGVSIAHALRLARMPSRYELLLSDTSEGHAAAERSLLNLLPLGSRVGVMFSGQTRQQSAGEFLAQRLATHRDEHEARRKLNRIRVALSGEDTYEFQKTLALAKSSLSKESVSEALRMAAALMDAGESLSAALELVRQKTRYEIAVN